MPYYGFAVFLRWVVSEKASLSREKLELKTLRWCVFGRTIFSCSLTAAAFPDVVLVIERQSQEIFEKSFSKVKKTFHLWLLQCHQPSRSGGTQMQKNFKKVEKVFLKEDGNLSSLTLTMPASRLERRKLRLKGPNALSSYQRPSFAPTTKRPFCWRAYC